MTAEKQNTPVRQAIEIAVYLGLIFLIVSWCLRILNPFISLLAWGAIIAVSIYTPFLKLTRVLGGRKKLAVTIIAVVGLAIVLIPSWMFADSLITGAKSFGASADAGAFEIKPPSESVKDWPLIGERLHASWTEASTNIEKFLEEHSDQLQGLARAVVSKAASIGIGILLFAASILVAAAFLASAETVRASIVRFCRRLAGDQGEEMLDLSVQTIRSVTVGVLGIAAIQALAGGIGMYAVGIPGVGVWTLVILILAIAQLPPWIVLLPMIIYVFSYETTIVSIIFMIWSLIVSFADMVLKPLLLGRGVAVPMLVVLLGAIGGMITAGVMGLFVGAVVLALGYKLLLWWISEGELDEAEPPADPHRAGLAE